MSHVAFVKGYKVNAENSSMYKCIIILCLFMGNYLKAQSPANKTVSNMEEDTASSNSLEINIGITNSAFSQHSSALSAAALAQKIFFVPAISFYHKSGFGVTATTYLNFESGAKNPFQYSVSPNYDYTKNKNFAIGASYNYYFGRDANSKYSSPYQHEIYAYYTNKQSWLNLGISTDFSTGTSNENYLKDSVITSVAGINRTVTLTAVAKSKTTDFIVSPTISHEFLFEDVFSEGDNLNIKPSLMLNAATGKYSATYTGNVGSFALAQLKAKKRNAKGLAGTENTKFNFQSAALAATINYQIGNLSVTPEIYVEYSFPKAESRFNYIYTINIGYSF